MVSLTHLSHLSHSKLCCHTGNDLLLFAGADIRLTNSDGESALYLVAYRVSKSSRWDPRGLNLLWSAGEDNVIYHWGSTTFYFFSIILTTTGVQICLNNVFLFNTSNKKQKKNGYLKIRFKSVDFKKLTKKTRERVLKKYYKCV